MWYGTMVRCRGYIIWLNFPGGTVCFSVKGRIRRMDIICNDLIYRPLETLRKNKPCGQADRQTDKFAIAAADTQFYKLRIRWG